MLNQSVQSLQIVLSNDHGDVCLNSETAQSTRRPRNLLAPEVARDVTKSHDHFPTSRLHPVITHPC